MDEMPRCAVLDPLSKGDEVFDLRRIRLNALMFFPLLAAFVVFEICEYSVANGAEIQGTNASRGSDLAHLWCATCHLFSDPELLDKKTWKEQTLPRMKIRMGLSPESLDANSEAPLLKATGLFPEKPMISAQEFQQIA